MRPDLCVLACLVVAAAAGDAHGQAARERTDRPTNAYGEALDRILKAWPARRFFSEALSGVELTCIATAGEEGYVGILRRTAIHAPMSAVENVLDDLKHYKNLFPGTVDVRVVPGSRSGNRFDTVWEQSVPVPLMPNVVYELSHEVDRTSPVRLVYRYRLRRSERLAASDGMVVVESVGPQSTQFTEYGFFHPRASFLPASLIWRESVRGAFLGNMAIKLKAENAAWSYAQVTAEAERQLASEPAQVDTCLASRDATAQRLDLFRGNAGAR